MENREKPFEFIRYCDPVHVLNILKNELPQTIALILSNIDTQKAAVLLQNLPKEMQSAVAIKIACMNYIKPEIIKKVEKMLYKKLPIPDNIYHVCGGMENLAEILFLTDHDANAQIMELLSDEDPELAEELQNVMQTQFSNTEQTGDSKDLVLTVYGHDNFVEKIGVYVFDKTNSATGPNKDVYLNTLNNLNPNGNSWVSAMEIKENLLYSVDNLIPLN